jgi:HJR/Mrr/RecB family endonuclease
MKKVFRLVLIAFAAVAAGTLFAGADGESKTLKVLMIGNSFSICVGHNLPKLVAHEKKHNIDITSVSLIIACLCAAVYFGHKALPQVKSWRSKSVSVAMAHIDSMSGLEFEEYTAQLLKRIGYSNVTVTKASGDQGIDVLATKDGIRYAIQCKNYSHKLDNTPVQEVYAGKVFYHCDVGVVLTNSTFTQSAYILANSIGVLLWDRATLQDMIHNSNRKRRFKCDSVENTSNEKRLISATNAAEVDATIIENLISNFSAGIEDELLPSAVDVILETGQASVSMLQRRLKIGYAQAARIVDEMEEKGVVGPFQGSKPRDILLTSFQWDYVKSRFSPFPHRELENRSSDVNPQFIAQAQWYAARGSADLIDDE